MTIAAVASPLESSTASRQNGDATSCKGGFLIAQLRRCTGERWGLKWKAGSRVRQRLVVAGIACGSPAARWNQQRRDEGLAGIRHGLEVVEVNGVRGYELIVQALYSAEVAKVHFASPRSAKKASTKYVPVTRRAVELLQRPLPSLPPVPLAWEVKNSFLEVVASGDDSEELHTQSEPVPACD